MSKFDVAKYWQFRVWVKSQIEQLRELVSEYQPSSGGGGDSDFDPDGAYPNMSVGKATTATTLASAPAISASGNGIVITAGGKTSSTLSLKTINGTSIIGSGDIDTRGDFDPDGTYPNMSVGTASDLAGRVQATPETFIYRPSAGDKSIRGNIASITSIKGNSVVWNQNAMPLTADSQYISNASRMRFTFANNRAVGTYVGPGMAYIATNSNLNRSISGHKYYRSMLLSAPKSGAVRIGQYSNQTVVATINKYNTIVRYDIVYESDGNVALWGFTPDSTWVAGDTCTIYDILDIDLTAMYGAGSEPTTEEFRAVFTDSYYPTTEMTLLRNLNLSGIETVGFNQWDGNAIQGYIDDTNGNYVNNPIYKCTGYIDVIDTQEYFAIKTGSGEWGAWYDADKVFISGILGYGVLTPPLGAKYMRFTIGNLNKPYDYTKFCVNLRHTGYRDGETEPYTKVLHNLPISEITNGEPLRSCGNVYDEITSSDYIKRVGVRAYESGDENNSLYLTDGIHTNYPLEQEIITPISTIIDFRYYVEDFGTEKAVFSANSAPLRADIIYSFNATDSIRNNEMNIQRINKKLSQIPANANSTKPLRFLAPDEAVDPYTFSVYQLSFTLSNDPDASTTIMLTPPDSNIGIEEITHIVEYEFTFTTGGEENSYLNIAGAHWGEISNEIEPNMRYIIKVITFDGAEYFITAKKTYAIN